MTFTNLGHYVSVGNAGKVMMESCGQKEGLEKKKEMSILLGFTSVAHTFYSLNLLDRIMDK